MEKAFFNAKINSPFYLEYSEKVGGGGPIGTHFHDLYEIYYLTQGEVDYFIEGKIYTVGKGTVLVIPPNTIHKSFRSHRTRILIYLNPDYLQEFPEAKTLLSGLGLSFFKVNEQSRVHRIMEDLLYESRNEKNQLLQKSLLCTLLVLLTRQKDIGTLLTHKSPSSDRIMNIINYIQTEYTGDITLSSTAAHFFMNPAYLSRIFKQSTGFTFSEYLLKYRLTKSLELLTQSKKNVTEIAFAIGFNSSNHFCKVFKAVMGVSPMAYKKKTLEKKG